MVYLNLSASEVDLSKLLANEKCFYLLGWKHYTVGKVIVGARLCNDDIEGVVIKKTSYVAKFYF